MEWERYIGPTAGVVRDPADWNIERAWVIVNPDASDRQNRITYDATYLRGTGNLWLGEDMGMVCYLKKVDDL